MKKQFIIFFSIVLAVYGAVHVYLYAHAMMALPASGAARTVFNVVFIVVSWSFFLGRLMERIWFGRVSTALVWLGSFWLGALTYFFLVCLLVDLVRLADWAVPFLHRIADFSDPLVRFRVFLTALGLVLAVVIYGYINARHPRLKTLRISINKPAGVPSLVLAVASDIHLGTVISRKRLQHIVDIINGMDADLVLLPGDVIDEDIRPVVEHNLGETLRTIRARHGVFAVTGNHEYIGGAGKAVAYLEEHGIRVLRDESVVAGGVTIVGRDDRSGKQFAGRARLPIAELLSGVNRALPIILMDHQPFRLREAVEQGVDLQLSGHTHHGQLWPFHWITNKVFEISWGYRQIEQTHFYVSCGAGFWGPPMRIGNVPEILRIQVQMLKVEG
jgi:uncharacterized protein